MGNILWCICNAALENFLITPCSTTKYIYINLISIVVSVFDNVTYDWKGVPHIKSNLEQWDTLTL